MEFETFVNLEDSAIASLVEEKGPRVVVCPINGTRRWYLLEARKESSETNFLQVILDRYLAIFELFFSHGIATLLTPILGPDIVNRGKQYTQMVFDALEEITTGEKYKAYYGKRDVRVRFYGDYNHYFAEYAPELFTKLSEIQAHTRDNLKHKLFWGMFAHDPVEKIARIAIDYYEETGNHPKRPDVVTKYYGEYLPPADIFIGMMPPSVFDYPLLDTGDTALYFTTAPTPYLNEEMLRRILYDYMFVRRIDDDYSELSPSNWEELGAFYDVHLGDIYGLGKKTARGSVWLPEQPDN